MDQKKVWNEIADLWSKYKKKQYEDLKEFLKNKEGKILDLGCGSGRNFTKRTGVDFYGVDFSENMIKLARKNAKEKNVDAKLFVSNAKNLPFEDNFFDYAIYIAALHCIESKETRKNSLEELFRVLKPKAKIMITVWSKNHKKVEKYLKKFPDRNTKIPWKKENVEYLRYYYIYEKEELENLLKDTGFKIVSSKEDNNIVIVAQKP